MEIVTLNEFKQDREKYCYVIAKHSKVFIYPTDTIYGIGCNAEDDEAVERIRKIKDRYSRPFSVIAPSKEWIMENCEVAEEYREYIDKLPGPYTLILPLKKKDSISPLVNNNLDTVGIRIPDHWISDFVSYFGKPIVTTSANKMGENFMTTIDDLDPKIRNKLDFVVYEGEKDGRPSKVIDLTMEDIEIIHR